jgi:hypothetical protein
LIFITCCSICWLKIISLPDEFDALVEEVDSESGRDDSILDCTRDENWLGVSLERDVELISLLRFVLLSLSTCESTDSVLLSLEAFESGALASEHPVKAIRKMDADRIITAILILIGMTLPLVSCS